MIKNKTKKIFLLLIFLMFILVAFLKISFVKKYNSIDLNTKIIKFVDESISEEEHKINIERDLSTGEFKERIDCKGYISGITTEEETEQTCDSLTYAYTYWVPNDNPDRYYYFGSRYFVGFFEFDNKESTRLLYESFDHANRKRPHEQKLVERKIGNLEVYHWSSQALDKNSRMEYRHMIYMLDGKRLVEIVSMDENVDEMLDSVVDLLVENPL